MTTLDPIPAVPTVIPGVGPVHAALPITLSEQDVSEWAVIARRTDMPEGREWSTHRVQVLVDEQISSWGRYDLTYEEAMRDMRERAGCAPPPDDVREAPAEDASYVIGLPVAVTLHTNGHVTFAVDLSEVARPRDVADAAEHLSDDDLDRVCAAVTTAIHSGTYTITKEG